MKSIIPIVCTVLICCTALFIYTSSKENNRYYYNVGTGGAFKIDRYNGTVFSNDGKGWINIEDINKPK